MVVQVIIKQVLVDKALRPRPVIFRQRVRKVKASTEVRNLKIAFDRYYEEYHQWPSTMPAIPDPEAVKAFVRTVCEHYHLPRPYRVAMG